MRASELRTEIVIKLLAGAGVLAVASLLKAHYSRATSEGLSWIIGPTALVTEAFSGLSFTRETGYGWIDVSSNVVIAPACAGVNFLIVALCASSCLVLLRHRSGRTLLAGLVAAGFASYLITLTANATRILVTTRLYEMNAHIGSLTPESLHRIAGTVIYYLFLCGYVLVVDRVTFGVSKTGRSGRTGIQGTGLLALPLCWYLLLSVGVPLLNDALRNDAKLFIEHATSVVCVSVSITLVLLAIRQLIAYASRRLTRGRRSPGTGSSRSCGRSPSPPPA